MEMSHWKNWITEDQYILYIAFNIIHFFHQLCVRCFIFCPKQTEEVNHYQYTHFKIRTTCDEFQSSTEIISQRNSISDCEIFFTMHTTYHKLQYKKQIPKVHVYKRAHSGTVD
jgi:hypothetical protein